MIARPEIVNRKNERNSEYDERVVEISRVSRVVKGGRRIRFRVLVVIGDRKGKVGHGVAKANEIAIAIKKAVTQAKKRLITVPIINDTIPYPVTVQLGSAKLFLGPARKGTSIVAGGVVRVVAELSGIKNLLAKVIGTSNKINNVKAVIKAFSSFESAKIDKISNNLQTSDQTPITSEVDAGEPSGKPKVKDKNGS